MQKGPKPLDHREVSERDSLLTKNSRGHCLLFCSLESGVLENLPRKPRKEDLALKQILVQQSMADGPEDLILVP